MAPGAAVGVDDVLPGEVGKQLHDRPGERVLGVMRGPIGVPSSHAQYIEVHGINILAARRQKYYSVTSSSVPGRPKISLQRSLRAKYYFWHKKWNPHPKKPISRHITVWPLHLYVACLQDQAPGASWCLCGALRPSSGYQTPHILPSTGQRVVLELGDLFNSRDGNIVKLCYLSLVLSVRIADTMAHLWANATLPFILIQLTHLIS